jgi:signal transduction histidine kinase
MIRNIRWSVYLVAMLLTTIPIVGAFYATRGVLESAIGVGLNPKVSAELQKAGTRLKDLAKANPEREVEYKAEFTRLQQVRSAYDLLLDLSPQLNAAYLKVFFIVTGISSLIAIAVASWLNRRIIQSHDMAVTEMSRAQQIASYLNNRESWKLVAQKMVHEVKNPLTPIQVMMARLGKQYENLHATRSPEFSAILEETRLMVKEEIGKISTWVEAFSRYARMPEPQLKSTSLPELLNSFHQKYDGYWPNIEVEIKAQNESAAKTNCDPVLVRQVLFNLAKNASEAAGEKQIKLELISGNHLDGTPFIAVADNGTGIPEEIRSRLFQPYTSTKADGKGMGLGLAIAKKTMMEHGGDITFIPTERGTKFELSFSKGEMPNVQ